MVLKHNSWPVWWAYRFTHGKHPRNWPTHVSLCRLFWRCVLIIPAGLLGLAITSPIWGPIMGFVRTIEWYDDRFLKAKREARAREWVNARYAYWKEHNQNAPADWPFPLYGNRFTRWIDSWILWDMLRAVKGNICPIVEIRRDKA